MRWRASRWRLYGAIIAADSGSSANWFARSIRIREGMKASLSGTLATMCPGVPCATAAKFTHPDRVAVSFVGDGAMQMLGNAALMTIAKYWRLWSDPRCVIAVLNNEDLNQVTWEMRAMGGFPKLEETQKVPPFDYAAYAASLGLIGLRVEHPDQIGPAWDQAVAADWFEEPVRPDDVDGLRLLHDIGPAGMDIAAGEYGHDAFHFRALLDAGAVDVLQADATRCCGITGLLQADALT